MVFVTLMFSGNSWKDGLYKFSILSLFNILMQLGTSGKLKQTVLSLQTQHIPCGNLINYACAFPVVSSRSSLPSQLQ